MTDWFKLIELLIFSSIGVGVGFVIWYAVRIQSPIHGLAAFSTDKQGLQNAVPVIALARHLVCVKGGELNSKFWSNDEVLIAAEQATNAGAVFRIIFGPKLDAGNKLFYRFILKYRDKFDFRRLPERTMPHFMTIDDKFISWETMHEALQARRGAIGRDERNAVRFRNRFEREWNQAECFDLVRRLEQIKNNEDLPIPGPEDTVDSKAFGFIIQDAATGTVVLCDKTSLESLSQELQDITVTH